MGAKRESLFTDMPRLELIILATALVFGAKLLNEIQALMLVFAERQRGRRRPVGCR
jgi:hypothetical protein